MLGGLFPGQGSQSVGMGASLAEAFPAVRDLYARADSLLGVPLSRIMTEGPAEDLVETRNTQPAIYLHSAALWSLLSGAGIELAIAAGHSLGEYSALHAAGALDFENGLSTVRLRGERMFEAGVSSPGAMAAVLGLDGPVVDEIARESAVATGGVVQAANYNAPGQTVLSGEVASVEHAMAAARDRGARRAVRLPVSGAFHSALMEPAAAGLCEKLDAIAISDACFPVVANATAMPVTTPDEIRSGLAAQLTAPVRWVETIECMVEAGVTTFLEVGPGSVLRGLVRRIAPDATCLSVRDPATLEAALSALSDEDS